MATYLPIERMIARELGIKPAQIMEWSTSPVKAQGEELLAKAAGVFVAYKPNKK